MKYDTRHGGPYDRGSADAYYGRGCIPHYFTAGTYTSPKIDEENMTQEEIDAYLAGYSESQFDRKNWE